MQQEIFNKYKDCTICLDSFKHGAKVKIMPKCQHVFHEQCCVQWLDYKFRCPNCNLQIEVNLSSEENSNDSQQIPESYNENIEEDIEQRAIENGINFLEEIEEVDEVNIANDDDLQNQLNRIIDDIENRDERQRRRR